VRIVSHSVSPDADVRTALDAFRRIVQALRTGSRETERVVGLSSAQLFALQQLAVRPGMSINELAAVTFTHQSSVSVVVQRLVERKLVVKVASRDDRRRAQLALTEAGTALLRRSPEPVQDRLIAAIGSLNDTERRALAHSLTEVARAIGAPAAAPMFFEDGRQQMSSGASRLSRRTRRRA
jgi:DNA-binding MarR family transcriptional regulator